MNTSQRHRPDPETREYRCLVCGEWGIRSEWIEHKSDCKMALRRLLNADTPHSKRDRDAQFVWLLICMIVPAAILAAALIVSWAR